MTEEEVKNLIDQKIDQNAASNQFAVSDTPFHTHSGSDSPKIKFLNLSDVPNSYYQQAGKVATVNATETGLEFDTVASTTVYSGSVNSNGSAGNLPTGWSSSQLATGLYQVIHHLGTLGAAGYNVVATVTGVNWSTITITKSADSFNVNTLYPTSGSAVDNAFDFVLIPF